MNYEEIKTTEEYKECLKRFSTIFHAKVGTIEGDEANKLAVIIKAYEDRNFVFDIPNSIEAAKYRMEQESK